MEDRGKQSYPSILHLDYGVVEEAISKTLATSPTHAKTARYGRRQSCWMTNINDIHYFAIKIFMCFIFLEHDTSQLTMKGCIILYIAF